MVPLVASTEGPVPPLNDVFILNFSWKEAVAGSIAGLAEHLAMFPFDTVKTRMQSDSTEFFHTVKVILRTERWTHFYRGCVPVVCSAVPAHAAYFSLYESSKRLFGDSSSTSVICSAAAATAGHDAVSVPFDVIKQRMQMDAASIYRNSWSCLRKVVAHEGITSLYISLPTTLLMNIPHVATQWLVYETLKQRLIKRGEREDESAHHFLLAGLCAGACAATMSTPMDNIKTQLQLGKSKDALSVMKNTWKNRGLRGFFTGVVPRVLYMAPSAAITLSTYECVKSFLGP
jgi:solute carrier family 25 iron transporter 28/37